LYRSTGVAFTEEDRVRLTDQNVEFLYIPVRQHAAYRRQLLDQLERHFHDPEIQRQERARIVRKACTKMIEDVLVFPGQTESVSVVAEMSRKFAAWSHADADAFSYFLDLSSHDYYTATHMVNVGVGCGLLIKARQPGDEELQATFMQGGLLHDVGKRGVPEAILNKEGRLAPDEWEQIRRHPQVGYRELRECPTIPQAVLEMTLSHHERLDGKGYPQGLRGNEISLAARLCAVVDIYDAICAARPYRDALSPGEALQIMQRDFRGAVDEDLLGDWAELVQRMVEADPQRAAPDSGRAAELSINDLTQIAPESAERSVRAEVAGAGAEVNRWADNRRRHPRRQCSIRVRARFLRQGKAYPVAEGEWVEFQAMDISQGGMQLRTPWPLARNDVLELELPQREGPKLTKKACVVRVRQLESRDWSAGMRFT
jgi:HD-GYP domain-containing protein (c-di-GMP phosphodiesterase class II)